MVAACVCEFMVPVPFAVGGQARSKHAFQVYPDACILLRTIMAPCFIKIIP